MTSLVASPRTLFAPVIFLAPMLVAQAQWTRLYPTTTPSPRYSAAMVFDTVRGKSVMFGGYASTSLAQTWLFDGTNWQQSLVAGPSARGAHAMAFDEARGVVVMFGGLTATGNANDTWEWNGVSWTQWLPAQSPAPRSNAAMAYDRQRQVTVLYGGTAAGLLNDLWEWNGTNWIQRTSAQFPPVRQNAAMAFDPSLGGILMFGGFVQNQVFDDQWNWNGTTWTRQFPAHPPYARWGHSMVADVTRRRVALIGDTAASDPLIWEWDGVDWTTTFQLSPSPRWSTSFAHDSQRGMNVMFGGSVYSSAMLSDTWKYQTPNPAAATTIGTGCAGTAGTAVLAVAPYRMPWLGDTAITQASPVPNGTLALFLWGDAATPTLLDGIGMPGCSLYVSPLDTGLAQANGGVASWQVVIPASTTLIGVEVAQQAAVLDVPANSFGFVLSSALKLRVGMR